MLSLLGPVGRRRFIHRLLIRLHRLGLVNDRLITAPSVLQKFQPPLSVSLGLIKSVAPVNPSSVAVFLFQATQAPLTAGYITGRFICQGETGAKQIKAWSDRIRAAVELDDAVPIANGIASVYVIHQQNGNRYTRDGFNSKLRNAKLAAKAANPSLDIDFTLHDLKAKGTSDLEGSLSEKQTISGH